jgi:hypothetical protein
MGRKTIKVGKLLKIANDFLAAKNTNEDEREAICSYIETVLHETKNYEGFRYLEAEHHEDGSVITLGSGSRRYYFVNNGLHDDYEEENKNANKIRV